MHLLNVVHALRVCGCRFCKATAATCNCCNDVAINRSAANDAQTDLAAHWQNGNASRPVEFIMSVKTKTMSPVAGSTSDGTRPVSVPFFDASSNSVWSTAQRTGYVTVTACTADFTKQGDLLEEVVRLEPLLPSLLLQHVQKSPSSVPHDQRHEQQSHHEARYPYRLHLHSACPSANRVHCICHGGYGRALLASGGGVVVHRAAHCNSILDGRCTGQCHLHTR